MGNTGDTSIRPERGGSGKDSFSSRPSRRRDFDRRPPTIEEAAGRDRVVIRLLTNGVVQEVHVKKAYKEWSRLQRHNVRLPLWRLLVMDPSVSSEEIYVHAANVYAFKTAEFREENVLKFIKEHKSDFDEENWDRLLELSVVPIEIETAAAGGIGKWIFATHDPTRSEVHQVIQSLALKRFEVRYAPETSVSAVIRNSFIARNKYLDQLEDSTPVLDMGQEFHREVESVDEEALEAELTRSRLINLFEAALVEAVKMGASDLHIFPNADGLVELQMRVDGELQPWHVEEGIRPESFLAVVKDNSVNVDRFEREAAQDGFIQRWIDDVLIRFRVSVLPIASARQEIHSESIVIRVLDDRKVLTDLGQLGLLGVAMERFDKAIRQPNGMIILTGPTGSGKSTTLVAALHQVVTPKVNVLTVEDPVEYLMRGIRQIKLGHRLNLEGALRSILRHDPDIVMVGEMRDRETAELAVKLSNTGHLTFSTLHTNDAPSAVSRLYKMGVEPFLIAYAINLVVGQRLVKKLCPECRVADRMTPRETLLHLGYTEEEIAEDKLFRAGQDPNCPVCAGLGYKGRRAVAETMLFTPAIRSIIMSADDMIDEDALRDKAVEEGMLTLRDSARRVALLGDTSIEEIIRVTGSAF